MCANNGKPTRRCDLSSDIHDGIKHVLDCHTVVEEVVRSRDGRCRIGSQVRSGTDLTQEGLVEFHGRYVVSGTSTDCDVVSLSSLQKKSHEWVDVVVHRLAPRRRGVHNTKQVSCCRINDRAPGGWKARNRTLHEAGGKGNFNPIAIELEGHLR